MTIMTNGTMTGNDAPRTAHPQLVQQAFWRKTLKRPEAGALGGAILVFLLFFVVAPPFRQVDAFTTVLYQSATIGIPAVAVSLLMIGGEFDLTAGVAVTKSSLAASLFATQVAGNLWAGIAFALLVSLAIGALNGYLLIRTRLHSFLVTLSTFLMLQGLNIALTKLVTGNVATGDISQLPGFASAHAILPRRSGSAVSMSASRSSTGSCSSWWRPGCCCARASVTGSSRWAAVTTARGRWACRYGG